MLDCVWEEEPVTLEELPDNAIIRGVSRHYDGGWSGFVRDTLRWLPRIDSHTLDVDLRSAAQTIAEGRTETIVEILPSLLRAAARALEPMDIF
jgi:hypothetical protein